VKRRWQFAIGLVISLVALVLALVGIDLSEVARALAEADYLWLIPTALGILAYLFARAVRWRLLLGPQVSLSRCFWVTNIGYLVSNVLPFRLGDPARAVVIGRSGEVSTAAALSTVVVERVLDMVMVVLLLAGLAPFIAGAGLIAGGAALAALAVLVTLAFRPEWGRQAVRWALGRVPRLDVERWAGRFDGLFEGLAPLRSGRRGLGLLLWSVVAWFWVVFFYWTLLRAFLPRPPTLAAPFLVCVIGLGMAVPSSPGTVGVFHAVARYALTVPFDVPAGQAVTIAFAAHAFQYLMMCALGLIGLARESISLGWVREQVGR
jgi:hypothetical protein